MLNLFIEWKVFASEKKILTGKILMHELKLLKLIKLYEICRKAFSSLRNMNVFLPSNEINMK